MVWRGEMTTMMMMNYCPSFVCCCCSNAFVVSFEGSVDLMIQNRLIQCLPLSYYNYNYKEQVSGCDCLRSIVTKREGLVNTKRGLSSTNLVVNDLIMIIAGLFRWGHFLLTILSVL